MLGLIGKNIDHSLSPKLHNHWLTQYQLPHTYELFPCEETKLGKLIKQGRVGFNVTMPYKRKVLDHVEDFDESVLLTQAANTLVCQSDGKIKAFNTDMKAALTLFKKNLDPKKQVCILGSGGAAQAILAALKTLGAAQVLVVARQPEKDFSRLISIDNSIELISWDAFPKRLSSISYLVNCSPLGMKGYPELSIDFERLPADANIMELVYTPLQTKLIKASQEKGWDHIDGRTFLIQQAIESFTHWFGIRPSPPLSHSGGRYDYYRGDRVHRYG